MLLQGSPLLSARRPRADALRRSCAAAPAPLRLTAAAASAGSDGARADPAPEPQPRRRGRSRDVRVASSSRGGSARARTAPDGQGGASSGSTGRRRGRPRKGEQAPDPHSLANVDADSMRSDPGDLGRWDKSRWQPLLLRRVSPATARLGAWPAVGRSPSPPPPLHHLPPALTLPRPALVSRVAEGVLERYEHLEKLHPAHPASTSAAAPSAAASHSAGEGGTAGERGQPSDFERMEALARGQAGMGEGVGGGAGKGGGAGEGAATRACGEELSTDEMHCPDPDAQVRGQAGCCSACCRASAADAAPCVWRVA